MGKVIPHLAAREYAEKAKKFLSLRGVKNGDYPLVDKTKHPQQWRDWAAYYRWKEMLASVELMDGDNTTKTVPSLSPYDFDPEFVRPAIDRRFPREAAE